MAADVQQGKMLGLAVDVDEQVAQLAQAQAHRRAR